MKMKGFHKLINVMRRLPQKLSITIIAAQLG